jgi:hypothetical protein
MCRICSITSTHFSGVPQQSTAQQHGLLLPGLQRIASGEFTDAGSTKERLTRPLRNMLAKDRIGPGERGAAPPSTHTVSAGAALSSQQWSVWLILVMHPTAA